MTNALFAPHGMSQKDQDALKAKMQKANPVREIREGRDATMVVPKWDRFMAATEAQSGGAFSHALVQHEKSTAWAQYARETFGKLYDSGLNSEIPLDQRSAGTEWVQKLHDAADALPEWTALKERARRDAWACGVAAGEALNIIAQTVKPPDSDPQELQDELDFTKSLVEGGKTTPKHLKRMADLQRRIQDAKNEHAQATIQLGAKSAALRSKMRAAANAAQGTIDEMDEAMAAMGAGDGAGAVSRVAAPPAEVRNVLSKNAKLRRILKIAGRMKSAAIAKQRSKSTPGREELCDVITGNDIERLLPSELLNLATEDTEVLLYRKLMESSALTYQLRGKVSVAEGPIILAVDESGSMGGVRDEWAKGVAFAMMEIAARQNRPFAYVHFESSVTRVDEVTNSRAFSLKEIEELCTYFTGGGTSIARALDHCAGMLEGASATRDKPWKRADVILISDGDDGDHHGQTNAVERIRKLNGHLYTIFIDAYQRMHSTGRDKHVSEMGDEVLYLSTAEVTKADPTKLGNIFSI